MIPTVSEAAELIARWDFAAARPLLEDLVDRLPGDELDGLSARRMLAEVLRELGESAKAYPLAVQAARECERRYGPAHPVTVRAGVLLGTVLHDRGLLTEAQRQYGMALHSGAKVDGPAGRALLLARANLALLRRDRGELDVAVRELADAYRLHRRIFGPGDPDTVRLAMELGRLYGHRGEVEAARRTLAVAYESARASLGAEHPLSVLAGRTLLAAGEESSVSAPPPVSAQPASAQPVSAQPVSAQPVSGPPAEDEFWYGEPAGPVSGPPAFPAEPWASGPAACGPGYAAAGRMGSPWAGEALAGDRVVPASRRAYRLAVAACCLLIAIAVAVGGLALRGRARASAGTHLPAASTAGSPAPPRTPAPGPSDALRPAPGDVQLRDDGTSITVSWTDPSGGTGTVLLAVSRGGQPAGPLRPLPAGAQQHVVGGLDPTANYCVILAIVYPGDTVARADQVCTGRHG